MKLRCRATGRLVVFAAGKISGFGRCHWQPRRTRIMTKTFQVLDGEPVATVGGTLAVLPPGEADVHRVNEGYAIEVQGAEAVTISAGELDRLIGEGQLHGVPAADSADDAGNHTDSANQA
jgi:hypothetical protein